MAMISRQNSHKIFKNKILVTTGDVDGIGLEVTYKALAKLPPGVFKKNVFFLYIHPKSEKKFIALLKGKFNFQTIDDSFLQRTPAKTRSLTESHDQLQRKIDRFLLKTTQVVLINSSESPASWVFSAAQLCADRVFSALVTGPLSKTLIKESGYSEIGHTEILQKISGVKNLYMLFIGKFFNVLLLTGHLPLSHVSKKLLGFSDPNLAKTIFNFKKNLPLKLRSKPLAFVGVNPHAGELGLIGAKEERFLLGFFTRNRVKVSGPLVPDAAFLKKNWQKYSLFICPYHDQGLIPFKMTHGQDSGVHITLGLSFVRTSVDHGTAKEIFGKNRANPNSMVDALTWATKLVKN